MIFEDVTRRRWKVITGFFALLFLSLFVVTTVFYAGMNIISPTLHSLVGDDSVFRGASVERVSASTESTTNSKWRWFGQFVPVSPSARQSPVDLRTFIRDADRSYVTTTYLIQNDLDSVNAFQRYAEHIDIVFPDWYFVTQGDCTIGDYRAEWVTDVMKQSGAAIMPRVTNGADGVWYTEQVQSVLHSPTERSCVAKKLATLADEADVAGLQVDIEAIDENDRLVYVDFLEELAVQLHERGLALTVAIPANDQAFAPMAVAEFADALVLMAYDEHYPGGKPGPIASNAWFAQTLDSSKLYVDPEKVIVAMGTYGYDWKLQSNEPARSLSFSEIMMLAKDVSALPELDPDTGNMTFSYVDAQGDHHEVWFLNAVTAWNEWRMAEQRGKFLGLSFWRSGIEDESIWSFLGDSDAGPERLAQAVAPTVVDYRSVGEFFRAERWPQAGELQIEIGEGELITAAKYTTLPQGYVFDRVGEVLPEKTLVLTFDDGPSESTHAVLDVLKKYQVPATFFTIGSQIPYYTEVVRRIEREGHAFGNHTYTHEVLQNLDSRDIAHQLTGSQRIIQSVTGNGTVLFRAPELVVAKPRTLDEARVYAEASRLGYIVSAAELDSRDWESNDPEVIIRNVHEALETNPHQHVLLFHDGRGNRSSTVEALDILIPELQAAGYTFISAHEAVGMAKQELAPQIVGRDRVFAQATSVLTHTRGNMWQVIQWLFYITSGMSAARILFMGFVFLTTRNKKSWEKSKFGPVEPRKVSVVIPAYNEEKTIEKTIRSVAQSDYPNYQIVVMNDGSTDGTAEVVERLKTEFPQLKMITKENGGKAAALNMAFRRLRSEIIVTIDADTVLYPNTVSELVKPLDDPRVDAVCGNVEVGNISGLLTGFQALEYITTQNFDRQAFDGLNCISVVPGATGAWRRKRVIRAGGYSDDTLTEDADITMSLLRSGGKIVYQREARSRTEAPSDIKTLAKQRFRWSYGTYQCLYKHRGAFFKGTLGWIAMPNMIMFQVLFPLVSPIGDLAFVLALATGNLGSILSGYILFLFVDASCMFMAFMNERRSFHLGWLILVQRFFYRQFMYMIAFRSFLEILKGSRQGWKKIQRTGSVQTEFIAPAAA